MIMPSTVLGGLPDGMRSANTKTNRPSPDTAPRPIPPTRAPIRMHASRMARASQITRAPVCGSRAVRSLGEQLLPRRRELLLLLLRHLRRLEAEVPYRRRQDVRDQSARHPFVVRGNYVPRRMLGARRAERLLERLEVVVPVGALGQVGGGELPVFGGVVEPLQEALLLLVLRDVEKELHDHRAVPDEVALERVDVLVAVVPESPAALARRKLLPLQDLRVHAHDEHVLVVR